MAWLPKRNVVVPCDFSDLSIGAVDTALEMVQSPTNLHVIHVLPELAVGEPGVVWGTVDDDSRREHALEAMRKTFADEKYSGLDFIAVVGDAGHEIIDYAESTDAELIVMPSHGRRGIARLLIGSVAERVVRMAHCPVLVLRDGGWKK